MLITKKELRKLSACPEAIEFFSNHYKEIEIVELLREVVKYEQEVEEQYKEDVYKWSYWLISKSASRKATTRFAVYAAEKVLHIYEDEYPEDKRPREAIEAAKAYLENPKADAIAYAARDAAYAAASAAYVAAYYAARDAADASASAAARASASASAAYCAYCAADAADAASAAWAADASAAWAASASASAADATSEANPSLQDEILEFGIKLIQEEEEQKC